MADLTIPDELRTTATNLRCEHSFPVQPPHGTLLAPGPCSRCGAAWAVCARDIPDRLREPLAVLLEDAAERYAENTYTEEPEHGDDCGPGYSMCPGHTEQRFCDLCGHEVAEQETGTEDDVCRCWNTALGVARAVKGGELRG
ncbi:hypothetical protein [Streptosporangium sp. V21-05]|uniref:hypothetical protein n=1 Tax=Streptosporangium sp. V21-05 TaxID=3446115 RepID=UPI003F533DBB